MAKKIQLMLLGSGGVGRQLLRHIVSTRALHSDQGLRIAVMAVVDSKSIAMSDKLELDDNALLDICSPKENNHPLEKQDGLVLRAIGEDAHAILIDAVRTIVDATGSPLIVADCTASEKIGQFLAAISELNCCIVLANKKPLTSSLEIYDKIAALRRRFRCESTVGAALPVISSLNRLLNSGDTINKIVGALSGTLGFVMSRLEHGELFSDIVKQAKSLGYTEPDPRDDLGGMDVARKALIMARLMGWRMDLKDVKVESLYPPSLAPGAMSSEKFLKEGILELDSTMKNRVNEAAGRGCVLRYVATVQDFDCKVGIVEQPRQSALGQLHGSDNLVEVYTRCYSTSPLVIKGAGAGNDTTAAGVLADIVDVQEYFE